MKKFFVVVMLLVMMVLLCSCDYSINNGQTIKGNRVTAGGDYNKFDYAYIILGDRLIAEGQIVQWRDFQSGDEIQIVIGDKVYLTHYSNVVMVTDANSRLTYDSYQDHMPSGK